MLQKCLLLDVVLWKGDFIARRWGTKDHGRRKGRENEEECQGDGERAGEEEEETFRFSLTFLSPFFLLPLSLPPVYTPSFSFTFPAHFPSPFSLCHSAVICLFSIPLPSLCLTSSVGGVKDDRRRSESRLCVLQI